MAALSVAGQSIQYAPTFRSENINVFGRTSKLLAPGMILELYGQNLAPRSGCGGANEPYPTQICGVRVLIGSVPAELMYVGSGQINLRIPVGVSDDGLAPFRVCNGAICSAPVMMRFATRIAVLTQPSAAYVNMPVWVHVDPPAPYRVCYPCWDSPWHFPDYQFEVRRNGVDLPPVPHPLTLPKSKAPDTFLCEPTGGLLPLHLLYHFDEPGTYAVRFTAKQDTEVLYRTDWTDIEIKPFSESKREELLRSLEAKMETRDAGYAIASLLALPDEAALDVLLKAFPANKMSCRNFACLRLFFGKAALAAFDDTLLRSKIPPERLRFLCPPEGKCR